jgi:phosphate acetyltransferase
MEPGHMLERVGPGTLAIVPGDREDVILTLTTAHLMGSPRAATTVELTRPSLDLDDGHAGAAIGLVLTGGYRPRRAVIEAIRRADLFATLVPHDTYTVASEVHDLLVKTHAADLEKIAVIKELVATNLDVDRILAVATEARIAV